MWLLDACDQTLHFLHEDEAIKAKYAILSHTWDVEEVTFQDIKDLPFARTRKGWRKIEFACHQARLDGLNWVWIDTCCIDKASSAELSEAINSMFRWYERSRVCYAYLSDVSIPAHSKQAALDVADVDDEWRTKAFSELRQSRWFKRGWTSQELVAPDIVKLYDRDWKFIGIRTRMSGILSQITGIEPLVLQEPQLLKQSCVAKRMSWAAGRSTTRVEDRAYSLLGIFDVNMPLIYGEGNKAFKRLQEEILRNNANDHSILLWSSDTLRAPTLLAEYPDDFNISTDVVHFTPPARSALQMVASGIQVTLPVVETKSSMFALLSCRRQDEFHAPITIWLSKVAREPGVAESNGDLEVVIQRQAVYGTLVGRDIFPTAQMTKLNTSHEKRVLIRNFAFRSVDQRDETEGGYNFWFGRSKSFDAYFAVEEAHPSDRWSSPSSTMCWPVGRLQQTKPIWAYIVWARRPGKTPESMDLLPLFITIVSKFAGDRDHYELSVIKTIDKPSRQELRERLAGDSQDWYSVAEGSVIKITRQTDDGWGVIVEASHELYMMAYLGTIKMDFRSLNGLFSEPSLPIDTVQRQSEDGHGGFGEAISWSDQAPMSPTILVSEYREVEIL